MAKVIEIDISMLYKDTENAKLSMLDSYINKAREMVGKGNDIILTGAAPVWLYLKIAHALHGIARKLIYRSPVTGDVIIFDHSPY
ncbi:MAG: CRISPR-associated protein Csx3 [Thermodesulfovibrio sp.]|nr:CRISPR-associated protein Csx3 [Thermodesulfovibrio sp.]MDW7998103.1 CRISPR-associated protein Csx3 [Thermodesulfovibrio sp.]